MVFLKEDKHGTRRVCSRSEMIWWKCSETMDKNGYSCISSKEFCNGKELHSHSRMHSVFDVWRFVLSLSFSQWFLFEAHDLFGQRAIHIAKVMVWETWIESILHVWKCLNGFYRFCYEIFALENRTRWAHGERFLLTLIFFSGVQARNETFFSSSRLDWKVLLTYFFFQMIVFLWERGHAETTRFVRIFRQLKQIGKTIHFWFWKITCDGPMETGLSPSSDFFRAR